MFDGNDSVFYAYNLLYNRFLQMESCLIVPSGNNVPDLDVNALYSFS